MKPAPNVRSPLRDRPLRYPGQSLDEMINRLWDDVLAKYIVPAIVFLAVALWDWVKVLTKSPTNLWVSSIAALIVLGYAIRGFLRTRQEMARLKLARDGEMEVGENLDALKREGAAVIHDLQGNGFNVDHVVLSRQGLFVVETKTRRKPASPNATISFDGSGVLIAGYRSDEAVNEAEAHSRWVSDLLAKSTGKRFSVRPVVVFPGWFVKPNPKGSWVWVLNPKALPSFVQNEPVRLSESDLHLAAFHLSRFVRATA